MLLSHLQKINRPSSLCPSPCPDEPATQDDRSPYTVGTQDQGTHQVSTGHWGFRIRRPARSPQDSGDSGSGDLPYPQDSGHSRKRVGLGVSVTEKVASVTHEGPFSFGDLHYWKSRQSKQYLQPVFGAILLPREHRGRTSGTNTALASSPRSMECWVLPRHTFKGIPKAESSPNHPELMLLEHPGCFSYSLLQSLPSLKKSDPNFSKAYCVPVMQTWAVKSGEQPAPRTKCFALEADACGTEWGLWYFIMFILPCLKKTSGPLLHPKAYGQGMAGQFQGWELVSA